MLYSRPLILLLVGFFCLLALPAQAGSAADSAAIPINPNFFDYDAHAPLTSTETFLLEKNGVRLSRVTYPSPVVTPFAANNTVVAFLYMPPGPGPHPAMVVLHLWLPVTLTNEDQMCRAIAGAGVAALLVEEPYSLARRPVPHRPDAELLSGNLPQMVGGLRQAVIDARRGADWLQSRPDIDPTRMGIGGISLGAILAPLTAGVDPRLKVVLTVVGGADIADTIWNSIFTHGIHAGLVQHGYAFDDLETAMAPFEAGRWLKHPDPADALMFNGRDDIFIRPRTAEDLARELGGARIVWLNSGHYGIALSSKEVQATGAAFLRSRFFAGDAPIFHAPSDISTHTVKLGLLVGGRENASPALAYQVLNLDPAGRFSLDAQLTFSGLAAALSARLNDSREVGIEFPLFHSAIRPRPFLLFHLVL